MHYPCPKKKYCDSLDGTAHLNFLNLAVGEISRDLAGWG